MRKIKFLSDFENSNNIVTFAARWKRELHPEQVKVGRQLSKEIASINPRTSQDVVDTINNELMYQQMRGAASKEKLGYDYALAESIQTQKNLQKYKYPSIANSEGIKTNLSKEDIRNRKALLKYSLNRRKQLQIANNTDFLDQPLPPSRPYTPSKPAPKLLAGSKNIKSAVSTKHKLGKKLALGLAAGTTLAALGSLYAYNKMRKQRSDKGQDRNQYKQRTK